ncbi:MAG: leucine--tRNA ligase, partial [Aureispira sp.]|nr:leucine--tRNA ligase [Aureispira sp.]
NKTNKAAPIAELISTFEQEGNATIDAATAQEEIFTAEQWNGYNNKEQDDVLMNYRLAYRKMGFVNWCEELGTVLANDEVKDGVSERGGFPVVKKHIRQWALRITAYAERLLTGLDDVDFSEALKAQQRNWIGRSEGASVVFNIQDHDGQIEVFTTRPDTIYGATFMVLAPEHELIDQITTAEQKETVKEYVDYVNSRSERDRMAEKKISGAFTGAYAINPLTNKPVPVWISEYVLIGYGTGAIMAVPSDDERDNRFAKHFGLDIIEIIDQSAYPNAEIGDKVGTLINSDILNGMEIPEAVSTIIAKIEEMGIGQGKINYRLRDANFSRQRYWGEPFPIKYDKDDVAYAVDSLPLELPDLDNFKPTREGKPPLARATEWVNTDDGMTRELDTMPGYAGSSWYFLRYMDADNKEAAFSKEAVNYWQDVDLYVGGAEHAVGHLMYSRFWHKFMHDTGRVPTQEPYKKLINQGMIQGVIESLYMLKEKQDGNSVFVSADCIGQYTEEEFTSIFVHIDFVTDYGSKDSYLNADGISQFKNWRADYKNASFITNDSGNVVTVSEVGKMSKSRFNVINPDHVVAKYGTDCFRMYEMFLGPLEDSKPWDTKGITGVSKFLRKFWTLFYNAEGKWVVTDEKATDEELKILHTAIKKITHDIGNYSFNTCVAHFMVAANELTKLKSHKKAILIDLVVMLAPFAPHITDELWSALGNSTSIHNPATDIFPTHDEKYLKQNTVQYPIQIGKKVRGRITVPADTSKEDVETAALADPAVQKFLEGKTVRKVIVVPKKLVNIVAN